ncbi:MAG: threonine ammonia-lyase [Gemmatimonadota bacterium]
MDKPLPGRRVAAGDGGVMTQSVVAGLELDGMAPEPIDLDRIRGASATIAGTALRTPMVELEADGLKLWLKLECLQPVGSFKIRGAANAMSVAGDAMNGGVWTASAGNMAQGVAWCARDRRLQCSVIVPDHAPSAKTDALVRLGATIIKRPFAAWWQVLIDRHAPEMSGRFIHPVSDADVIAGNGTVGLEIVDALPSVEAIAVPYGGGGLACGIAVAAKSINPAIKIFAVEVETAAPFARSLIEGRPVQIEHQPSFVDGIGGRGVLPEMWPLASALLDGSIVVTLEEVATALRLTLQRSRALAEGAGAAAVAGGLRLAQSYGSVVAVVSGGNIDSARVATILSGGVPQ